jgi:hypothetical protein
VDFIRSRATEEQETVRMQDTMLVIRAIEAKEDLLTEFSFPKNKIIK